MFECLQVDVHVNPRKPTYDQGKISGFKIIDPNSTLGTASSLASLFSSFIKSRQVINPKVL